MMDNKELRGILKQTLLCSCEPLEDTLQQTTPIGLTYLLLVTHICVNELGQHRFRYLLIACSAPSHYLNQCGLIVNWTRGNEFR